MPRLTNRANLIWFLGSTMLAQTFMQLDLIDEYRININPKVLGSGKLLFAGLTGEIPLKLLESKRSKAESSRSVTSQNAKLMAKTIAPNRPIASGEVWLCRQRIYS